VTPRPVETTPLDIDIIREMYREGVVNIAGIDPRLNASRIAERLHVGRRRVAARLKVWKDAGFLRRHDVWINPTLLGLRGGWLNVRVEHPRVKPDLLRRLELVDGVVSALDFVGEWFSLGFIAEDTAAAQRKAALIRSLAGVAEIEGPAEWNVPAPKRPLTPLDLRIVRALRERPDATLSDTARRVGISTRTMTRRYSELVDDAAVWFVPVYDFRSLVAPVIALTLTVLPGTSPKSISRAVQKRFPLVLESRFFGVAAGSPSETIVIFVILPSAASIEDLHHLVEPLEGVEAVELLTMVRILTFPEWFDRHLAEQVASSRREPPLPRS
jgi:DNA-binding Lrp family transcriptional regulator